MSDTTNLNTAKHRLKKGDTIPLIHTQQIELFKDLPILWKSFDPKPTFIVKDSVNKFIISIYPPGGNRVARSMIDSYNEIQKQAHEQNKLSEERYTKIVFQPSDAVSPRVLSYGTAIREALMLGKRLITSREVDPIITITSSAYIVNEIKMFGNAMVWIHASEPTQIIYDFIHDLRSILYDPLLNSKQKIEASNVLFKTQTEFKVCYTSNITNEDIATLKQSA